MASAELAAAECSEAREIWGDVKASGSVQVVEEYLSVFGDCAIYSGLARERLAVLQGGQAATQTQAPKQKAAGEEAAQVEPSLNADERACLRKAMPPLHVASIPGVSWANMSVQEALVACAPVAELENPDADALAAYGRVLMKAKNYSQAFTVSQRATELGSGLGANNMGRIFAKGRGVDVDPERAIQFYKLAAERGSPLGYNNLGDAYHKGKGVEVDGQRALTYLKVAASHGYAVAYSGIGHIYRNGTTVPQDIPKALEAYQEAFELGDYESGAFIGYILETGEGGYPQDESQALDWYAHVALKGEYVDWAAFRAGNMVRDGRGVPADEDKAANWYRLGEENDHAPSRRELGKLYYSWGYRDEAQNVLGLAAAGGDDEALELLIRWFGE